MIALLLMVGMFSLFNPLVALAGSVALIVSMVFAYAVAFRHDRPRSHTEWLCGGYVLVLLIGGM